MKYKIKLTDLDLLFSQALNNYNTGQRGQLDSHKFRAYCFLKACDMFIKKHGELDLVMPEIEDCSLDEL